MKLTSYTDYALRVMIHLGTHNQRLVAIAEIAHAYDISQNNLMKIVQDLGQAGFVETIRGRNGGIRLARPPSEINVGALVRHTEGCFLLADCPNCVISPACRLTGIFAEAVQAFLLVLDRYTVADLLTRRRDLQALFARSA